MKILQANKYFYVKGGSDQIFFDTAGLLEKNGHDVIYFSMKDPRNFKSKYEKYFISKMDFEDHGLSNKLRASFNLLYSFEAKRNMRKLIDDTGPELAHLHSIYHQVSPSILHELRKSNIPVVLTLHDYKMVCASYLMLSGGDICESCKNGKYYKCVQKMCVKNSRMKSVLCAAEMYLHHKLLRIYDLVDVFISPSKFLISKFEEMGFRNKIVYLPNFVDVDKYDPSFNWTERSIIYFGRISEEKGLITLVQAMKGCPDLTLKIVGEGPLKPYLESFVKNEGLGNIKFLGYQSPEMVKKEVASSMFAVIPSKWYENCPRSIIEAFALGKPVIGSRIGGIPELIKDGETGLVFEPNNAPMLEAMIRRLTKEPSKISDMGRKAREFVQKELSSEKYYKSLIQIYDIAIKTVKRNK